MSKKKKLIPELRFPEFNNEGEWEEKTLGECLIQTPEYGISAPAVPYSDELPTYLRITDISENGEFISKNKVSVDWEVSENNYLSEGDIVLARTGASVGKSYKYRKKDGELVFAGFLIRIKPNSKKIDSELLFQFLFTSRYWKWVNFISARSGQPGINGTEYSSMPIILPPSIKEQQKIASCLSSLDELIEAHNQKLDLLKDHKKGLMQNLFPQEGEKMPKYRFAEFKNNEDWIKETVGDVYDFKVTNSLAREYLNYEDGSVKNIHYGDIHTKFKTLFDITKEEVPFINKGVSIEKIRKESYCNVGDIIFADASEDMNDVGKSIEIVNLNKEKLVSGLHTLLARQKKKKLAIGFGGYLFKSDWVRKQIQREAQGAKVLGISATRISNVQILYPENHKEQQKIASCLASLDELITEQAKKIEQLKQHKKGLMQGLFPKIED
jgi:type I restriction enzyme, S subunit